MPELPEVETIRRQIAPMVSHQQICSARVTRARAVRAHCSPEEFITLITRRVFLEAQRRGKVLLFPLDNDSSLLIRLGMSGQVVVTATDAPVLPHTHVVLELASGNDLRYIDPRTFGQVAVVDGHDPDKMVELAHYGVEPLDDAFTPATLQQAFQGKKALIQSVLMDQTVVVGIGKIYADESCFLAGIDPRRQAASITPAETVRLHAAIRDVLTRSIASRGTSGHDKAYKDATGNLGSFQDFLNVYQRENQPCRRCGTLVEYRPLQGRRMHFCPHCQK